MVKKPQPFGPQIKDRRFRSATSRAPRRRGACQITPEPEQDTNPLEENGVDEVEDNAPQSIFDRRLELFQVVERGEFDWKSENQVRDLLYGSPDEEPETLLHHLIDYLRQTYGSKNTKFNGTENGNGNVQGGAVENLEKLAKFALTLDPTLLKTSISRGTTILSTPLFYAIEKQGTTMEKFVKLLCEATFNLKVDGSERNICQEAIDEIKDDQTCLHYAISKRLGISRFLVEMASRETLLMKSGPDSNTPLHEAVNFRNLGMHSWWVDLVKFIVEKNPFTLLQMNRQGHSPYRHHIISAKTQNESKGPPAKTTSDDPLPNRRSQDPYISNKVKDSSANDLRQTQAAAIQQYLYDECLGLGGHKEAFEALWGSHDGNPRTWLNLLDVPLPVSHAHREKLLFRAPERHLGFVGIEVPRGINTPELREKPIKSHPVVDFFNWLRNAMHVQEILRVVVKDDQDSPCSDEVIEESLKGFKVKYLDWDRQDISSPVFVFSMRDVRGISLHWSGNDAVLRGWADYNGLAELEDLGSVHLIVQQNWDSIGRTEENIRIFKEALEKEKIDVTGGVLPQTHGNTGGPKPPKPPKFNPNQKNIWLGRMAAFTEEISSGVSEIIIQRQQSKSAVLPVPVPVKIAIIDDGVNPYGQYNIDGGISFNLPYNGPPEYFPSTLGHGTAMAKIIYKVCPTARLYIAKLNETVGRRRFTMKHTAKAIQWAVDMECHIISCSWTIDDASKEDIESLTKAIKNAKNKNIIIFCAARDEGKDGGSHVYPYHAGPDPIIRIGATDQYGDTRPYVPKEIDYLLPGVALTEQPVVLTNIPADELNSGEGSSEATALASGVAGLVMTCFGTLQGEMGIDKVRGVDRMKALFEEFCKDKPLKNKSPPLENDHFIRANIFQQAADKAKPKEAEIVTDNTMKEVTRRMENLVDRCLKVLNNANSDTE